MRIAIIGVGGIGGYVGCKLASAYSQNTKYEIVFIQRGEHYEHIKKQGLTYITRDSKTVSPHEIYNSLEYAGLFDIVFITVKSRDLEQTARLLKANIHSKSVVISLLNGVNNAKRLQTILPNTHILNGCIYVSASIKEPGIVQQTGGAGKLIFGPEDGNIEQFIEIESLLIEAGIKAELSESIQEAVWEKFIFISSWASISAKYMQPVGYLLKNDNIVNEWRELIQEILIVANAEGIVLSPKLCDDCINKYRLLPVDNKTSMQIDIENGKKPEIDIFTGYIVETAKRLKVSVPMHNEVLEIITKRL